MTSDYNIPGQHPELDDYFDRLAAEAAAFRSDADGDLDVAYGPSEAQRIDFFAPGSPPDAIVLFFHGGFWVTGDRNQHSHLARGPLALGLSVGVAGYGLAPDVVLTEIVDQAKAAVAFASDHTSLPVVVAGHSAGGHLVAMAIADPSVPTSHGVAVSGIFDLEPLVDLPLNRLLRLDIAEARRLSPIHLAPPSDTTLQLAVGEEESEEWHGQTRRMEQRWPGQTALHVVHEEHHLSVVETLADPESPLTDLCRKAADRAIS